MPDVMLSASDFMARNPERILDTRCVEIDFLHTMTVVELDYGVVVEFTSTDSENITLTETLFSNDREFFKLLGRCRSGGSHHEMRSYDRDTKYPLKGIVRL